MIKGWAEKNVLLLYMLIGIALGNVVGNAFLNIAMLKWLGYGMGFGIREPVIIDLGAINITIALLVNINIAGIVGMCISIILFKMMQNKTK